MEKHEALPLIAWAAVQSERATGLPAELTAAQCIQESGWLSSAPGNNPFGIKFSRRHAKAQLLTTTEVCRPEQKEPGDTIVEKLPDGRVKVRGKRAFAAFDSLADAFIDHAMLITTANVYGKAWQGYLADHDLSKLIDGVAARYASDPQYAVSLKRLAAQHDVAAALVEARGAAAAANAVAT